MKLLTAADKSESYMLVNWTVHNGGDVGCINSSCHERKHLPGANLQNNILIHQDTSSLMLIL